MAILNLLELNSCLLIFSRFTCLGIDTHWLVAQWSHGTEGRHMPQPRKVLEFTSLQVLKELLLSPRGTCSFSEQLTSGEVMAPLPTLMTNWVTAV